MGGMTTQTTRSVPSQSSVPALRVTGWAGVVVAVGLYAEVLDLSTRGHGPALVLLALACTASGLLGMSVGFTTVTPATGRFRSRWQQQPRRYKVASYIMLLAFAADLAICCVGLARMH
jgi:hypothetical protein